MSNEDPVRLVCPQCQQPMVMAREDPAEEIICPGCDGGLRLERLEDGGIGAVEAVGRDAGPSDSPTWLQGLRPQKRHAGPLILLVVFLGIYFFGAPWLMFRWAMKKAEKGDVVAQMEVGLCYETGSGPWRDYGEAIYWYSQAAQRGHGEALYLLFGGLQTRRSGSSRQVNVRREFEAMIDAQANSLYGRSRPVSDIRKYVEFDPLARNALESLADRGSLLAQLHIARVLYDHHGVNDEVQSVFALANRKGLGNYLSQEEFEHPDAETLKAIKHFFLSWGRIHRRIEKEKD